MQQIDPFYQQLPFTLQDDQLTPDYVIFGTGLQQSALSAYLSKMKQHRCLILDQQKNYGSCLKTVTLKQLHLLSLHHLTQRLYNFYTPQLYTQPNLNFFNQCISTKSFRGYNIDIQPSFFFGDSITCQCLKQADMDKYMDFRLVSKMMKYQKGVFSEVPLSKGKIFQAKQLSMLQKKTMLSALHTLMKISQRYLNIEEDHNSTKEFDKGFGQVSQELFQEFSDSRQAYFLPFLEKLTKKSKKIVDFMSYIICNYQHNVNLPIPVHLQSQYSLSSFINRFGKFISSCGIYGQTPYLYVDNGIGDIPQAFSRISSIFGSTYILHPKLQIDSITQSEHGVTIRSNIAPGKEITAKKIFYGETYRELYVEMLGGRVEEENEQKDNVQGKNEQKENMQGDNEQGDELQKEKKYKNHKAGEKVRLQCDNVLRVVVLARKIGGEEECPSIGYFVDLQGFVNPVYMFMFDDASHTCPAGYILYQFSTVVELPQEESMIQKFIDQKVQIFVEKLCQIRGKQLRDSIAYLSSYIRESNSFAWQPSPQPYISNPSKQICLQTCLSIDLDQTFQNFRCVVGRQQNYFRKKNPYQQDQQQDQCSQLDTILSRLQTINLNQLKQHDTPNDHSDDKQHKQCDQQQRVGQAWKEGGQ